MTLSPPRRPRRPGTHAIGAADDSGAGAVVDPGAGPGGSAGGVAAGLGVGGGGVQSYGEMVLAPGLAPRRRTVAELVERIGGDDVVDADDVVTEISRLGVDDDDVARERYGMSLRGLGVAVLTHLRHRHARRGVRRAPVRHTSLVNAMIRCALYLGPVAVMVAAAPGLPRFAWPAPFVVALLGWSTAQALTSLGASVARTAGRAVAARMVAGGFAAASGVWGALLWVAPDAWLGGSRVLAFVLGLGGLAMLATVTAALVIGRELAVIRWSLPCWLLGAITVAAQLGSSRAAAVPVATLLPAAIVVAVVRAFRPVIGRTVPDRSKLTRGDRRRCLAFLVLGAAQVATAGLLLRHGSVAVIPLLVSVPFAEALIGWHLRQVAAGLDLTDSRRDHHRHVRTVAIVTVAGLTPPLVAGLALAAAASRLPEARTGVLAIAAGTLFAGVVAATRLLAARGRTAIAASCATLAPLAIVALPPGSGLAPLPAAVAVCTATHLLGLLAVAHTAADHRRMP